VGIAAAAILGAAALRQIQAEPRATASAKSSSIGLRPGLQPDQRLTAQIDATDLRKCVLMFMDLTGRSVWPNTNGLRSELDEATGGWLSRWKLVAQAPQPDSGISFHGDGALSAAEAKVLVEAAFTRAGVELIPVGKKHFRIRPAASAR
jgi:hypothetical protein